MDAAAPLVDVQSAGISEVVENDRIVELPLQGRQVTNLIVLAGAAVNTGDVSGQRNRSDSVAISVAGGLRTGVAYVLDGAMHNDPYDNTNMPFPFPDALQEFTVATSGLSAQNGMHSGASVNAVTRSGTNAFHGNGFEFLRHSGFNAHRPVRARRRGRRQGRRWSRSQSVRWDAGWTRSFETSSSSSAGIRGRSHGRRRRRTSPSCRRRRCSPATSRGSRRRRATPAGRCALRAPFVNNQINPAQFSQAAVTYFEAPADAGRSVRRDQVQRAARQQRQAVRGQGRLSDQRQPLAVCAVYRRVRESTADVVDARATS